uniref:CG9196-PA n=1 Tax=Drosophila virilis TaxID=7244 RepID=Q8I199_DROVI|nr:CG9196-PA [Drosophila virilis]
MLSRSSFLLLAQLSRGQLPQSPSQASPTDYGEEPPEGYYAFVESPNAVPPRVRPPPYTFINADCKDVATGRKSAVSVHNICGDLNKGQIPRNPLGQNVLGEPYPFELIRNQTLKFLSKTLPVLKADDTLPKVTQIIRDEPVDQLDNNNIDRHYAARVTRSLPDGVESNEYSYFDPALDEEQQQENKQQQQRRAVEERKPRKFCDGGGVFCTLYRAIQGDTSPAVSAAQTAERREEVGPIRYEGPPTPCPAKVEYATPVFAKNYQGAWRYVVQIPYEGYFTQTVEVTRCIQARCHYLDGGCLSSPRWVSLLVAEIFYPNAEDTVPSSSTTTPAPSVQDFQAYQQYLQKRAGVANASDGSTAAQTAGAANAPQDAHCDGHDELGCFQVRLYYDWFLIPGSCKCWRPDYFAKYVRRKSVADL